MVAFEFTRSFVLLSQVYEGLAVMPDSIATVQEDGRVMDGEGGAYQPG